jgi:hypothetical protein
MSKLIRLSIGGLFLAMLLCTGCEDGASGASYTAADLAGTWNYVMRETSTGTAYEQGTITFDAAGNLTAWTEAEWTGETGSGQLAVSGSAVTGTLSMRYTDTMGSPTTSTWTWDGDFSSANQMQASVSGAAVANLGIGTATIDYQRAATLTR